MVADGTDYWPQDSSFKCVEKDDANAQNSVAHVCNR